MSSTVPSRDNDYRFPPAPAKAKLDRAVWDAVLSDLSQRMREVEEKGTALDDLLDTLSFGAQTRVDETIAPIIAAAQADVAALSQQVASTLAANQEIIDNFQAVTAVNLEELENKIAEVEQRIAVILAGGIAAADVAVSPARQFVTAAERQEIAQLREDFVPATPTTDGIMSAADKARLDGIKAATPIADGLMSAADKGKLDSFHNLASALNLHFGS